MGLFDLFGRNEEDDNNLYYKFITNEDKVFYAHYRKSPEWLLHEYFTGVSIDIKLRGAYIEFNPKPFNGSKKEFKLREYDGQVQLSKRQFDKILDKIDTKKKRASMKKILGIKELELEDEKPTKSNVKYSIFSSEIGQIYCYKLDNNCYQEFFTDYKCHVTGNVLIFDYCDTGFDATHYSPSGNDTTEVRNVDKDTFALGIDGMVKKYGSVWAVKNYITDKLEAKIEIRDRNLAEYRARQKEKNEIQIRRGDEVREAIKKYGIK